MDLILSGGPDISAAGDLAAKNAEEIRGMNGLGGRGSVGLALAMAAADEHPLDRAPRQLRLILQVSENVRKLDVPLIEGDGRGAGSGVCALS